MSLTEIIEDLLRKYSLTEILAEIVKVEKRRRELTVHKEAQHART